MHPTYEYSFSQIYEYSLWVAYYWMTTYFERNDKLEAWNKWELWNSHSQQPTCLSHIFSYLNRFFAPWTNHQSELKRSGLCLFVVKKEMNAWAYVMRRSKFEAAFSSLTMRLDTLHSTFDLFFSFSL